MYDRLLRQAREMFDPELGHLGLINSVDGREVLENTYREYLNVARETDHPIVVFTPTWRANQERVTRAGKELSTVNAAAVAFVRHVCARFRAADGPQIYIGGLSGCKNDCYDPAASLDEVESERFHAPQISALAGAGADFLFASTLPAVREAIGIARPMARTGLPYVLSFVADGNGAVLDGTSLAEAFAQIDAAVHPNPLGYFINCIHPEILAEGLDRWPRGADSLRGRLIGFQGNTSRADPRTFDSLPALETESPGSFAEATIRLRDRLGLSILGGCCGTGPEHIHALGEKLAPAARAAPSFTSERRN